MTENRITFESDPAGYVEAARQRNKQRQYSQRWIPVSEKLPRSGEWCLVACLGIVQRQAAKLIVEYDPKAERVWAWAEEEADYCPQSEVTHWMPLPDPPEVKK